MKYGLIFSLAVAVVISAYLSAQSKLAERVSYDSIKLGMTAQSVSTKFGTPSAQERNRLTYILDDNSELQITLRDDLVSSAKIKFLKSIKIEDPEMKKLTLVQMDMVETESSHPSWFFAGSPEKGLIYKITSNGLVESITWVPPFSFSGNSPRKVGLLYQDFKSQQAL
jgi:hypothetical protein